LKWKRISVGPGALTLRNDNWAIIIFYTQGGKTHFMYLSEGKAFCEGAFSTINPEEIPWIVEVKTTKIRKDGGKFLKLWVTVRETTHITEVELLKR